MIWKTLSLAIIKKNWERDLETDISVIFTPDLFVQGSALFNLQIHITFAFNMESTL